MHGKLDWNMDVGKFRNCSRSFSTSENILTTHRAIFATRFWVAPRSMQTFPPRINFFAAKSHLFSIILLCQEKTALMATLRNQDERLMQERKRQAALAKLRREQRKARQEENFDAAALVIGLAQKGDEV